MLARAADVVKHDLLALKRDHPVVFERQIPRLARVERRFGDDAAAWEGDTFVITSRFRWDLLGDGELENALVADFFASLQRRFASVQPEAIAAADQADYFAYATRDPHDAPLPSEAATEVVLRLAPHVVDPRLAADVRAWLFARAPDMANPARAEGKTPEGKRARAAWTVWLGPALSSSTAAEKLIVARAVYGRTTVFTDTYQEVDNAIDGFDAFAFALSIADAWARDGHPLPPADLVDLVLSPPSFGHDGKSWRGDGRESPWVIRAMATDADVRRLDDALAARNDEALTSAVVYSVPRSRLPNARATFLRDLERHPDVWRVAMRRS